jgi:hypothetical protein
MRFFVGLFAVLATTSIASAESYDATQPAVAKDGYIGVGAEFGGQRALMGGVKIDGGHRLGDTPWFARAQVTGGASGSDGNYQQVRAGVEARGCLLGGLLCGFAGVDAGYQHDHMMDKPWFNWGCSDTNPCSDRMDEVDAHDLMAVPRVGVELGTPIRLRAALDIPFTTRLDEHETRAGAALSLGVGYAF